MGLLFAHTLILLTGQPPLASLMRARLLAFALLCGISSETTAVISFPELAQAVSDKDTVISVAAPYIRFTRQLDVRTTLTIESAVEVATVLSGGNSTRLFFLHEHRKLWLRSLDLTHGNCTGAQLGSGGVIYVSPGAELVLNSVSVTASWALRGGAIYAIDASVVANDCTLESNFADVGGALFADGCSVVELMNCTMISNSGRYSGGVCGVRNCTVITATNCTMKSNSASAGGVFDARDSSIVTTTHCTMTANSAAWGGTVCTWDDSTVLAADCTMTANSASRGGAVYTRDDSTILATDCTMTANFATGGGAVSAFDASTILGSFREARPNFRKHHMFFFAIFLK